MKLISALTTLALTVPSVLGLEESINSPNLKILVHSNVGRSHIKPIFEVCKVLQARGHQILYAANADNEKFAKEFNYNFASLSPPNNFEDKSKENFNRILSNRKKFDFLPIMGTIFTEMMTNFYQDAYLPLYKVAKEFQPDLIMCDFFAPACRDVADQLNIPFVIGYQTTDVFNIVPSQTTTGSMDYAPITTDKLTFWERVQDKFLMPLKGIYYFSPMVKSLNNLRKQYGVPTSFMPFGRFDNVYGIANTFVGFEPANNIPPNINVVGPILSDEHAMLSFELKTFFDNNQRVLFIAFGSNVPLQDFDVDYLIKAAVLALENDVIDAVVWGLGKTSVSNFPEAINLFNKTVQVADLIEGTHDKIRILKWAPQVDILKHQNTRAFISHGGLESTFEAITSGTPIVSIPVFGDQPRNAMKIENMGIGKYVDRLTCTPEQVYETIKYVVEDPDHALQPNVEKFKTISLQNSKRKYRVAEDIEDLVALAKQCRKTDPYQSGKPHCEVRHLIPVSTEMSFIKANNLDLYLFVFSSLLFVSALIFYISYLTVIYFAKYLVPAESTIKAKKLQ